LDWHGVDSCCLLSYFRKKVVGDSRLYQLLNFFGALGIVWNTFVQQAWPAMTLNVVWALIAVKTLLMAKKTGV